ncbi:MAG: YcaO-like family protein [Deltaproteobacteria bacterium]|nr:YcaO-like family protein [Deltaproteobacteria bacterium]
MSSGIVLKDCFKTYTYDQDKSRTPRETIDRVRARLQELDLDILKETMRIDSGRLGIPIFISRCGRDAVRVIGTQKQMGKGGTPEQSEASALMELAERFSFFDFIKTRPFIRETYRNMKEQALPFEALGLCFYDRSPDAEKIRAVFEDIPLSWVQAYNLTRQKDQWIPIDWFYLIHEYNGPSAGNTLEESILQGLCEVIERHVSSVISQEALPTPTIDPASITDPAARDLIEKFDRLGIKLFLKDFSLDTGIPTVGSIAYDPSTYPGSSEIVFTAGTTPNPEKSLIRAVTEIAQLAGDFNSKTRYRPTLPKYQRLEEAQYVMANPRTIPITDLPDLSHENIRQEIESCVQALARVGLEVYVVKVTHPQLGIPAVYTLIPGAHFRDRTRHTGFLFHLVKLVSMMEDPAEAIEILQKIIQLFPDRYEVHFFLGFALERNEQPEEAMEYFNQALQRNPREIDLSSIYCHIGVCLKDLGRYEQALEFLDKAKTYNAGQKEIYNTLGFCYFKLKEHHKAIEAFEKAVEIDPGSGIDYANIGANLRELGFYSEAVNLFQMALEIDPTIEFAKDNLEKLTRRIEEDKNKRG